MARHRNDGKELEGVVRAALASHQARNKSYFCRFYDSTTAGGAHVPAQPGDFLWLLPGAAVLVECKSTEEGAHLIQLAKGSKSSREQVPKHRLWHLSGHPSIYVWGDLTTRVLVAYDGASVAHALAYGDKTKLTTTGRGCFSRADALFDGLAERYGVTK